VALDRCTHRSTGAASSPLAPWSDPTGFLRVLAQHFVEPPDTSLGRDEQDLVHQTKFLLFRRAGVAVLAIVPGYGEVNPRALQKTNEPQAVAELLDEQGLRDLGFQGQRVHPVFRDPNDCIPRLFVDAVFLAQAILFPQSELVFPIYDPDGAVQRVRTTWHAFIGAVWEIHGREKVVFANITRRGWPDPILGRCRSPRRNRPCSRP
jgi:hypothetical protein